MHLFQYVLLDVHTHARTNTPPGRTYHIDQLERVLYIYIYVYICIPIK